MTQRLVSDYERQMYGDDLLSVVDRQARQSLGGELQRLSQQNQQLAQRIQNSEARSTWDLLREQIPDAEAINTSPEFAEFLSGLDIYSGQSRAGLLRAAFDRGESARVLAIFQDFISHYGGARQQQSPRRQSAAPRSEKPTFTAAQVARFYADGRGRTFTPEQQKQRDATERQIIAAGAEGRIVR
jgi:hypothetical protein